MKRVILAILCAVIYMMYWPLFWFSKRATRYNGKWRGFQFRATLPIATWAYNHFGEVD